MSESVRRRIGAIAAYHKRELGAASAYAALLLLVAIGAPSFYSVANLRDLLLSNAPVLVAATGLTLVILVGQIDISAGSQFAVCSVFAGLIAKADLPLGLLWVAVPLAGGVMGAANGVLVTRLAIPSIVTALATMVALRDALRWATEGRWVQGLPADFQWLGLGQVGGQMFIVAAALLSFSAFAWGLRNLSAGRAVYATGSNSEAAWLAGIDPRRVTFNVFAISGSLVGVAALLNSIRFAEVQSNAGVGLELKVIAAVVVGGTSITGGRGTLIGTLIGVALLGTVGNALTFMGVNPFWEKAAQGLIVLAAVASEVFAGGAARYVRTTLTVR